MATPARRASDVRISEVDLSSALNGASPSTAALVVVSSMGPLEKTFFSNSDDFKVAFGDPNARVSFDHYCALDYFKGGNSLWACRAVGTGFKYSGAVVKLGTDGETVIAGLTTGVEEPRNPDFTLGVISGEVALFQATPKNGPGSYADNLGIQIISENIDTPTGLSATTTTLGGTLGSGTYEFVVSAVGRNGDSLGSAPLTVIIGGVSTTNSVTISWTAVSGAIGYKVFGRTAGTPFFIEQVGGATTSFRDTGSIVPDTGVSPITDVEDLPEPSPLFTLRVYDFLVSSVNPVETYNCSLTEQTDDTGIQMEITQRVNPFSKYLRFESNVLSFDEMPKLSSTGIVRLAGGASGTAPTAADINAQWDGFKDKQVYVIDMLVNAGRAIPAVQYKMDEIAQLRSDCVGHLDAPQTTNSAQDIVDYRNLTLGLNSSYSVLFCSDALELDPISGKLLYIPMSGLTAGLQARVSRTTQPWFSIAGLNRGLLGVPDVRLSFDDGEATLLTTNNISYPRRFVKQGTVLWEANTLLNRNSALQFLNIRVLCNIIKRACYDYLLYGLQEPGDELLHKQLQLSLDAYMDGVRDGRGIRSYRVVIDETNNTPNMLNSGTTKIAVIIVPMIAVREIQMTLAISKAGMTVSEAEIAAF